MKSIIAEVRDLEEMISQKEEDIALLERTIIEKINSLDNIVEELALYISTKHYPTEIYPCFGIDSGEYDSYKDISLKIVWNGYTDVVGLSAEDFMKLQQRLMEISSEK